MSYEADKPEGELHTELQDLREQLAQKILLEKRLATVESELADLKTRYEKTKLDITQEREERAQAEKAVRLSQLIVDQSPVVLFRRVAGDSPKLEYVSDNLNRFGYSAAEFLRGEIMFRDVVHPDDGDRVAEEIKGYAEEDVEEYTMYYRVITKAGDTRWVEDQTSVVRDEAGNKTHNQGILIDITERKQAEDALRKSEEKFRRIVETAAEGFVLTDEQLGIVDVNKAYCRITGYKREELLGKTPMDLVADEFRQHMMMQKESFLAKEYREFETKLQTKDGKLVPILIHGNILRGDQGEVIGNMAFITDMTEHKKALILAAEVQKSLLPQGRPLVQGLDIAGRNVSCDEIGGDYYDFLWRRESRHGPFSVVVGDISGHGVDSALLMTTARAFLRMRASQPGSISEIITAMNRHLTRDVLETGRFMTLFYLSIDPQERTLSWVRAGHDPAMVYDPKTESFEELKGEGIALGVTDKFSFEENKKQGLENGQIIAVGTDGIWEAFNSQGEMFGKKRLQNIIRRNSLDSAHAILTAVYDELEMFTMGQKSEDDITLVIIKVAQP